MSLQSPDDSSCDEATSSLGDSAYDFLDDRSMATTSDGERDNLLIPVASNDQSQGGADTSELDFSHDVPQDDRHVAGNAGLFQISRGNNDSGRPLPDTIEFEEPSITNLNVNGMVNVSYDVSAYYLPNDSTSSTLSGKQNKLMIRQSMATMPLYNPRKSYKVMYMGSTMYQEAILQKVATALAVSPRKESNSSGSPRSTRFNVVPISSFGDAQRADVVLVDSSDLELHVEDCIDAAYAVNSKSQPDICMTFADETRIRAAWNGCNYVCPTKWVLPDLVIICHSESSDGAFVDSMNIVGTLMQSLNVPYLPLSSELTAFRPKILDVPATPLAPHFSHESSDAFLAKPAQSDISVLTVEAFLRLEPGQMNRNLACLAKYHQRLAASQSKSRSSYPSKIVEVLVENGFGDTFVMKGNLEALKRGIMKYNLVHSVLLWTGVCLMYLLLQSGFEAARGRLSINLDSLPTLVQQVTHIHTYTQQASSSHVALPSAIPAQSVRSLSTIPDISSMFNKPANHSKDLARFEIFVLGDRDIIIKSPTRFTKRKSAMPLTINVQRHGTNIKHSSTDLFDGVTAIQIPWAEAYGKLSIAVATLVKPTVNETFQVDYESSWLQLPAWNRAYHVLRANIEDTLQYDSADIAEYLYDARHSLQSKLSTYSSMLGVKGNDQLDTVRLKAVEILKQHEKIKGQLQNMPNEVAKAMRRARVCAVKVMLKSGVWRRMQDLTEARSEMLMSGARNARASILKLPSPGFPQIDSFKTHLQKSLLKAWWSVRGMPERESLN